MTQRDYLDKLHLFHLQTERLRGNRKIFGGFQVGIGTGFELDSRVLKKMDPRDIKEVLLCLRPFLLNDEPIFFLRVCNLIQCNTSDVTVQAEVAKARAAWKKAMELSGNMILPFENERLSPSKNLDLWLNGELFHLDTDKVASLKKLKSGITGGFSFLMLLETIKELFVILDSFDQNIVAGILRKEVKPESGNL